MKSSRGFPGLSRHPLRNYPMGPGEQSHLSCKSHRSPPHVDFLLQTELTLRSPTANRGFLIPPPFPAGLISLKFTGISLSDFYLLPDLAASSRNLSQASFSWETRPSCSWSWTTPDPFGKQEIQSGLAGDSVGRINISSALSTFSRSSFFLLWTRIYFQAGKGDANGANPTCQAALLLEFTCLWSSGEMGGRVLSAKLQNAELFSVKYFFSLKIILFSEILEIHAGVLPRQPS